jgi:ketosteroid isomerase-like protein
MLTAEDKVAIGETVSLHGHLFDEGRLDALDTIFTPDVVYDLSELGMQPLHGIEAIRRAAVELGPGNPLAHHVTNIVVATDEQGCVTARSKGLAVLRDGRCASATYADTLRRDDRGRWRISHRIISARREPLNGAGAP